MSEQKDERIKLWDEVPGYDLIEEIDIPERHSWFLDATHSVPSVTPLYGWFWSRYCGHGLKVGCQELSIPTCKGWEWRFRDGGLYCAFHIVRDEQELAEREEKFREAIRPWMEKFDELWEGYKQELLVIYNKLKELDVDKASNLQLYHHNYDLIQAYIRMWEIHFLGQYPAFNAWLLLEELCQERFGIKDQDPEFQNMLRGFDNKVYQVDIKMWEFGQIAVDMQLEDLFKDNEPQEIVNKLQQSEKGKEWFKQFMNYLETDDVGGWRMRRMNDFLEPYWLEDPSTPIGIVKDFIAKGAGYSLEEVRKDLAQTREAAIESFLQRVPPREKGFFEALIRLAGKASSYSEEHCLYCELYVQALMRRGYLGIGRRLTQKGTIDKPEDVFFLNPDEIDRVIMVPEANDLRFITRRRRANWEEWLKRPNPPVFTDRADIEEALTKDVLPSKDPIATKTVVGELPEVEEEADVCGLCGSPGEIEGTARVVTYYEDLKYVQPGEILVSPGTNPAWTPTFGIVSAVITDRGGTLSHAAIVGREFGIPTIVNTFEGSSKIKTGMLLKVNATKGTIYFMD